MRSRSVRALLASVLFSAQFAGASAQTAPPTPAAVAAPVPNASPSAEPEIRTLPDGLRVVVLVDRTAPIARVATYYRFGAAYETRGKTGLAHGLEHMMFRGTPSLSAAGLDDVNAQLGADVNAQTSNDYTVFTFAVPAKRVDLALRIEADRMQHLSLSPSDWNVEKQAVLHEWDQDYANPIVRLFFDVNSAVYPNSPYGKPALGVRDDVERATAADLRTYYREWYAPNNATVVVAGDVDPEAVFAAATEAFAGVPSRALPNHTIDVPVAETNGFVDEHSNFPIEVDDIAYALPGNVGGTENDVDLTAMFTLAINNPHSAFHDALVDSGLTLGFFALPLYQRHGGVMHVLLIVSPGKKGADVRAAFQKVMQSWLADGVPGELYAAAKRQVEAQLDFSRDSLATYATVIGGAYVFPGDSGVSAERAYLASASLADVNAAAKHYFAKPNATGVLDPRGTDLSHFKPPADMTGKISDSFSNRVPTGRVVQPPAIRESLETPLTFENSITPSDFVLPNGLRVLIQENHAQPTFHLQGVVASSPAFAPAGKEGIDTILASTMPFGGKRFDFEAQRAFADRTGATLLLGTSFSADAYSADFDDLLAVIADDVRTPALPPARIALARTQNVAAYKALENLPGLRAERAFDAALYPKGDPELREPTAATVASITDDDVRAYAAAYLRPDLTTIAIVGDVDPARVRASFERLFGDWTAPAPVPVLALPALPEPKAVRKYVPIPGGGSAVAIGAPAPARGDPDYDAFALMNSILGNGSFDSRLFRELREKRGLVYGIASKLSAEPGRSTVRIDFSTTGGEVAEAVAGVRGELKRMQNEPVTATELRRGKLKLVSSTLISEDSYAGVARALLELARFGLPDDYYATLSQRYAALTAADLERVAKKRLYPDALVEVRTGP